MSKIRNGLKFAVRSYFRVGVHLLLVVAGILGVIVPPPTLERLTDSVLRGVWSASFIIGGLLCMWGLWRLTLRPQIIGSILIAVGLGTYTAALVGNPQALAVFFIMLAFTQSQATRGVQLRQLDDSEPARLARSRRPSARSVLAALADRGNPGWRHGGRWARYRSLVERVDSRAESSRDVLFGARSSGTDSGELGDADRPGSRSGDAGSSA